MSSADEARLAAWAAFVESLSADAEAAGEAHYLIGGEEFGYPGQQLHVFGDGVLRPFSRTWICTFDERGIRQFHWYYGWSRLERWLMGLRWVGTGNGELVLHHVFRRSRFRISSIVDIEEKGDRPVSLSPNGWSFPQYRFTLHPPAEVRYFGLFSRRQTHVRIVPPNSREFLSALGGRWRDIYDTDWLFGFVWDELGAIRTRARERKVTFRDAAIEAGIPGELFDATYRLTQTALQRGLAPADFPECQTLFRRYEELGFRGDGANRAGQGQQVRD